MRKKLFLVVIISVLLIFSCFIVSCGQVYSDAFTPDDVVNQAMTAVTAINADDFAVLRTNYVEAFIGVDPDSAAFCVMHTNSSARYDEFGVFKCNTEADAKELLDVINAYLDVSRQENVPIAQSYAPDEVPKLENACAKRFGVYVTYAVLDDVQRDAWFAAVENYLS